MNFNLALEGFALLFMFSVIFGGLAHVLLARSSTPWMWPIGAVAFFVGGLIASEIVWGTATVDEVQPIIGGLAVDESMLGGLLLGVPVVLVSWYLGRQNRRHRAAPS